MASYEHEHHMQEEDGLLQIARMIVRGGWTEQLSLNFDNLFPMGERPAHPEAIAELPVYKCNQMKNKEDQCLICLDTWQNAEEDANVTKMPCNHLFHQKCIELWLQKTNSCPLCRCEIRSSNSDYEEYKQLEKRKAQRQADLDELHNSMFS